MGSFRTAEIGYEAVLLQPGQNLARHGDRA